MAIKVILWDLDGVLADTTNLHYRAFNAALYIVTGNVISHEEHIRKFNGLPSKNKLDLLLKEQRIQYKDIEKINRIKQDITIILINEEVEMDVIKVELLEKLQEKGYLMGCVTNCSYKTTKLILKNLGIYDAIEYLWTNEQIKPKPNPDGYLKAIDYFNVDPKNVLICEDAPKGILAAKATGAHVWEVAGPHEVTWNGIYPKLIEHHTPMP